MRKEGQTRFSNDQRAKESMSSSSSNACAKEAWSGFRKIRAESMSSSSDVAPPQELSIKEQAAALQKIAGKALGRDLRRAFAALHPEHAPLNIAHLEHEYVRFMVLKCLHQDTDDDTRFSPPPAVDDFWHTHILVSQCCLCSQRLCSSVESI